MSNQILYQQAQQNKRATDEMSFKLISLVPLATLLVFIGSFFKDGGHWNPSLYLIGVFGSLIVFGIYRWELRNIQNCYRYCNIIEIIESTSKEFKDLKFKTYKKPKLLFWVIGKTQAEKIIYSTLVLSWLALPIILRASTSCINNSKALFDNCYYLFCSIMVLFLIISAFTSVKKVNN